jgi:hypothetical protein
LECLFVGRPWKSLRLILEDMDTHIQIFTTWIMVIPTHTTAMGTIIITDMGIKSFPKII